MELRGELCGRSKIEYWANKYPVAYDICMENLVPDIKERGHLTRTELVKLACWKLPERWKRGQDEGKLGLVKENTSYEIEVATRNAFLKTDNKNSIRCLRCLKGVDWAIGSAILHWFHECRYPIWDLYARWSVQIDQNYGSFKCWDAYVELCKAKADQYEVDMRTLDRGLLKYGQANRPSFR